MVTNLLVPCGKRKSNFYFSKSAHHAQSVCWNGFLRAFLLSNLTALEKKIVAALVFNDFYRLANSSCAIQQLRSWKLALALCLRITSIRNEALGNDFAAHLGFSSR
jgi:hypothetical protein